MAETKERRKTPRKATPKTNGKGAAPRKTIAEERSVALDSSSTAAGNSPKPEQSPEEMRKQIEEAAYYRAKQRGFAPGYEFEDWIQAESEVRQRNEAR